MSIQAIKQALEALEAALSDDKPYIIPSQDAIAALRAAITEAEKCEPVFIVFDGPPSHESGRFVEVETASGKSISAGEWNKVSGFWNLGPFYTTPQPAIPDGWQLVPVKLPREVETSIWMEGFNDVSDAWECFLRKLAAAPKPENSHE